MGLFISGISGYGQAINFPDDNFISKLLLADSSNQIAQNQASAYFKIDANNDGEIDVAEALEVSVLNINNSNIFDATGLTYFSNLKKLNCSNNLIPSLSLTGMTQLIELKCTNN